MTDTTDTTTFEQSKTQRVTTAIEFFHEKFADADEDETGPFTFIDPKGDDEEVGP